MLTICSILATLFKFNFASNETGYIHLALLMQGLFFILQSFFYVFLLKYQDMGLLLMQKAYRQSKPILSLNILFFLLCCGTFFKFFLDSEGSHRIVSMLLPSILLLSCSFDLLFLYQMYMVYFFHEDRVLKLLMQDACNKIAKKDEFAFCEAIVAFESICEKSIRKKNLLLFDKSLSFMPQLLNFFTKHSSQPSISYYASFTVERFQWLFYRLLEQHLIAQSYSLHLQFSKMYRTQALFPYLTNIPTLSYFRFSVESYLSHNLESEAFKLQALLLGLFKAVINDRDHSSENELVLILKELGNVSKTLFKQKRNLESLAKAKKALEEAQKELEPFSLDLCKNTVKSILAEFQEVELMLRKVGSFTSKEQALSPS